ncbi:MAG: hypothetical protein H6728_06940 [Myxococcales bacterium]|nr:hypothetical protein [Myxococcales bacterium]
MQALPLSPFSLEQPPSPKRSVIPLDPQLEKERKLSSPKRLCCVHCMQPITTEEARIEIGGQHTHIFTNPAGFVYRLGCFREAEGLQKDGPPCHDATWFAGYAWQILRCASCGIHLGWLYIAPSDAFFGLILPRLILKEFPDA